MDKYENLDEFYNGKDINIDNNSIDDYELSFDKETENLERTFEDEQTKSLYSEPKKVSFLQKFMNFVSGKDYERKTEETKTTNSIFDDLVNTVPKGSDKYEDVKQAAILSEEALKLFKQKLILINRSKKTDEKLSEMSVFNTLSEEETKYLKMILNRYIALVKEKNVIAVQLSSFDKNVYELLDLEKDAKENLPKIVDAEKKQRIFKTDINHIEGEKEELMYEMDSLVRGRNFLQRFTYVFIGISVVMSTFLSFMGIFYGTDIFMQLFVLIITIMCISTFLIVFRSKITKEQRRNIAFQKRAVELLNKKNAVYAYYTSFLRYEYKKYKVSSSVELNSNLRELGFYKQHLKRMDSVRRVIHESEYEIDQFMTKHNIKNNKISLLDFAETINIEDQRNYYINLEEEREKMDQTLKELDEKHSLVFDKLLTMREEDTTENAVIDKIIQTYYDETHKLLELY